VLALGIGVALVFLIAFALIATQLLHVTGLILAGGLLLLWVAWDMCREIRHQPTVVPDDPATPAIEGPPPGKTFLRAAIQVTLADLSMSLDNVLAVAATARDHPAVLFLGLAFSVSLMGLAANYVARLVQRFRWIAWAGLPLILYVALRMIYDGVLDRHYGVLHVFL
jgi:YjbE family integral membrane protein